MDERLNESGDTEEIDAFLSRTLDDLKVHGRSENEKKVDDHHVLINSKHMESEHLCVLCPRFSASVMIQSRRMTYESQTELQEHCIVIS